MRSNEHSFGDYWNLVITGLISEYRILPSRKLAVESYSKTNKGHYGDSLNTDWGIRNMTNPIEAIRIESNHGGDEPMMQNDEQNDKELEIETGRTGRRLPSLEIAKARMALSLQRYKIAVEKDQASSETEPEKIRL